MSTSVAQLTAIFTMMSAGLGVLTYIARMSWRSMKALDGHLDALRQNTVATQELSARLDRVEQRLPPVEMIVHSGPA